MLGRKGERRYKYVYISPASYLKMYLTKTSKTTLVPLYTLYIYMYMYTCIYMYVAAVSLYSHLTLSEAWIRRSLNSECFFSNAPLFRDSIISSAIVVVSF